MRPSQSLVVAVLMLCFCVSGLARTNAIPPDEPGARDALEDSPRHGEWVEVNMPARDVPLRCYVVYPETAEKAPVVLVIHEIFGLTDWIRAVADQLAADGFIAIAPDFLSGMGPQQGGTDAFASRDDVRAAIRGLSAAQVVAALDAAREYGAKLPASNGRTAVIGFCWGGTMSWNYAVAQSELNAAVVYYGTSPPDSSDFAKVSAPVLGLYGEDDARVNATIEPAQIEMRKHGKSFAHHIYDGAGHGFLRQQDGRDGANLRASEQAWPVTIEFLREHTR